MIIVEGDLKFDFSNALNCRKFDSEDHGLSHCMKAVDFIVELRDRILFVEVKDPQHPRSPSTEIAKFERKLRSNRLIREELVPKCRDSFLYEYAMENITKPIYFLVLIALTTLTEPDIISQKNNLKQHILVDGVSRWKRQLIHDCFIFTIASWNRNLSQFPVTRVSLSEGDNKL